MTSSETNELELEIER